MTAMNNNGMTTERIAIVTGSFDPITSGHLDLVKRASIIFNRIYVVILANTEKKSGLFAPDERLELAKTAISDIPNAEALVWSGLTSDIASSLGAKFIVRGARSATDFDYENNLAQIMRRFDPALETVILPTSPELSAISSTYVRDLIKYGCPLGDAVPESCIWLMERMINKR